MKLISISILVLTFFAGLVIGADMPPPISPPISVAVYDFTAAGEASHYFGLKHTNWNASMWNAWRQTIHNLASKVTVLVTADLSVQTNLIMVERAELTKALKEQAFGLSGMVSSDAAAKIGQITGAKVLVAGQVFTSDDGHLTIVASIIGTETSRYYSAKVEGSTVNLGKLTDDLSQNISETISKQYTNLIVTTETRDVRVDRIVKAVKGKKRPSILISIVDHLPDDKISSNFGVVTELGILFQKTGFTVIDEKSSNKPDIIITGIASSDWGLKHGELYSCRSLIEIKVQKRRTGDLLNFDRQENEAVDIGKYTAAKKAMLIATDNLAERLLPLLAQ